MKTRRLRQFPKRCLAIVLAFVFALSGTNVAGWQVKAADDTVTVSSAEDTAKPIHVKLTAEKTIEQGTWGDNSPSEDLTQYAVSVVNGTEAAISDWQLTIACSSLSTYNAGWNGASKSGNNIVVGTYKGTDTNGEVWTNSTIAAGESANGAGFQVAARELTGATYTLTYKNGESSGSVSVDDTATDPAAIGTKSDKVTATLTKSNEDGEYHEYFLKIDNKSSDSIGDWIVAIPMTGVTKVQDWSAWAKVQAYYTSDYLYVAPVGEAVISSGGSFGSTSVGEYKFNYNGSSSPSGAVVYYKTGTSSSGAFQSVISNASGGSSSSGGSSGGSNTSLTDTTTNKNLDIEYNYAKLLQESLYFYDANMCGDEVSEKCGLNWRGDCHTSDKTVTYNGKTVDVSGGFHDAGDHVKFGLPQGYSATVLALSYYEFKEAYDELGQTDHYKTIMDHFCDYFKRCTVYNGDSVEAFCYQVGEGGPDHSYWGAPESQPVSTRGSAFFANASNPATDEVCVAAAALALHGYNFNNTEYIKVAEDLFAFAKTNSKSCATDGAGAFYGSSDWKDDYCSAAAALYVATKKDTYKNELSSYYTSENIKTGWVLTWDNTWAVVSALQEDWPLVNTFAAYGNNVTPQGYKVVDEWGSARYNTTLQFLGLVYDQGKDQFSTESGSFCSWATGQMNYLLGNNDNKRCFVVGYNENSSQYPHHRAASRSSNAGQTREDHYTLLGALVGGPKNNDVYADDQSDYNCNEVALDYNAGFVGAAAGLYLLHKNNSSVPKTLATEEELSEIGVTKYYSATPSEPGKVSSVSLNKKTLSLLKGESDTLSATVTPSTATDKSVTWKSSNESVATVDTTGKVTAVGKGTATITVTTTDGNKTATCTVTVSKKTVTITTPNSLTITAGTKISEIPFDDFTAKYGTSVVDGTFQWTTTDATLTAEDDDKTLNAKFVPTNSTMYDEVTGISVTVSVQRKTYAGVPDAPALSSKTHSTVTLVEKTGVEYGISSDGEEYTWQSSNTFTGLSAYTSYFFAQRYSEDNIYAASGAGESIKVATYYADSDCYKVDISKVSDDAYVEAHNGKISYDADTKTLTLTNAEGTYTITGENSNIKIQTAGGTVILDSVKCNGIVSSGDLKIKLSGDNAVSGGIAVTGDLQLENQNTTGTAGSITVTGGSAGAITANNITILSGEVTATGTGEAAALNATETITLTGGSVTVNAAVTPVQANKVVWIGTQIQSDSGTVFSVNPVDANENPVNQCNVTYKDGDSVIGTSAKVNKGAEITLPNLPAKQGYKPDGWTVEGSEEILAVGSTQTVSTDTVYVAVYTEITGSLQVSV
ncbi:MAG: glycoside hydrolase family 9 protein, partial [Lachnospiraceae bacterium]|nr:glycoside hydrolase family 9 protein [Lachnospiraceae bacterium]